jgi:competence protein ComEA
MIRLLQVLLISWLLSLSAWAGVNVNLAGSGELESLPGIGPAKAAAIIAFRTDHGSFTSLADLDRVPGIGPATLANIGPLITFVGQGQSTPVAQASGQAKTAYTAVSTASVNVNTAASSALISLPGIGPSKAAAIIADRTANGPFASCSDLQRVHGIGPATVANIAARCATK